MELEHRVIKLELRVDNHAEELQKLQDISDDLHTALAGIEKTLAQIKYLAMGAVTVVIAHLFGTKDALKLFL